MKKKKRRMAKKRAKPEVFVLESEYSINYTTTEPVPIDQVIDTLVSIERMIHRTGPFMEKAYDGVKVVGIEVYVDSLQAGSLTEKFFIKYILRGEDNAEKAKEVIEHMLQDNEPIKLLIAVGIGGFLTWSVMSSNNQTAKPVDHIEAYNNTIINVGGQVKLTGDDIAAIIEAAPHKKSIVQDAVKIIKPAKADPQSTIEISGINSLTIDPGFIKQAPDEYVAPMPDSKDEVYKDAPVVIYASDRDKTDSAWAGIVPGIVDTRTKIKLDEGIDPAKLHGRINVKADITVTSKFDKNKKIYVPKEVLIKAWN